MVFQEPAGNGAVAGKIYSSSNSNSSGNVIDSAINNRSRSRENLCNSNGNGPSLSVLAASQSAPDPDQLTREQHGRDQ
jgi:hypothetical protein